jgi:hypothetical protein
MGKSLQVVQVCVIVSFQFRKDDFCRIISSLTFARPHVPLFSSLYNPELTGALVLVQAKISPPVIDWAFLVLSPPHALVLRRFQKRFARRIQRKPNTVIEGGPIYFFNLERGLIGKGIEIVLMKFKTNC